MLYLWPSIEWIIRPYIGSVSSSITILSSPINRRALMPLSDKAKFIERPDVVLSSLISVIILFYIICKT